jgi:hypothetical protein
MDVPLKGDIAYLPRLPRWMEVGPQGASWESSSAVAVGASRQTPEEMIAFCATINISAPEGSFP